MKPQTYANFAQIE
ncbi:hypothetical protein VCHC56A1_1911, partial [Vibrio cholerae HC-56A1]